MSVASALSTRESDDRSLEIYLREIRKRPLLKAADEVRLAKRIARGDRAALSALVLGNLRFVVSVARQYQGRGIALADLINEGNVGLIKAAERFDHARGFRFISYAIWWIRQAILSALNEQTRVVRIPVNRAGRAIRIDRAAQGLEQTLGRLPSLEEIAARVDLSVEEVVQHQSYTIRSVSMDAPASEEGDGSFGSLLADEEGSPPDRRVIELDLSRDLRDALAGLDPRERKILRDYFGMETGEGVTLEHIGKELGLTRERVRQLKDRAMCKIRHRPDREKLRSYLHG